MGNTQQGVCDLVGNVQEWIQDEFHSDYIDAPADGSAWCTVVGCPINYIENRIIRGSSWTSSWGNLYTTRRTFEDPSYQGNFLGGRLVRSLDPQIID